MHAGPHHCVRRNGEGRENCSVTPLVEWSADVHTLPRARSHYLPLLDDDGMSFHPNGGCKNPHTVTPVAWLPTGSSGRYRKPSSSNNMVQILLKLETILLSLSHNVSIICTRFIIAGDLCVARPVHKRNIMRSREWRDLDSC